MPNKEISIKLKELRVRAGLSQKQAYEKLGVSQSTFSSWEIGKSEPDAMTFLKLCEMYNVSNILETFGYPSFENEDNIPNSISDDEIRSLVNVYAKLPESLRKKFIAFLEEMTEQIEK